MKADKEWFEIIMKQANMEMQYLDDINNPLEPLKLSSALQSEIHKYNYRKEHKPQDISPLDYTIMYALKHCLEERMAERMAMKGEDMKATGIVRRIDGIGRINIPKEIRMQIFGTQATVGEPMEIFLDGNDIVLRKYESEEKRKEKEIRNKTIAEFAERIKEVYPFTILELEQLDEIAEEMRGVE